MICWQPGKRSIRSKFQKDDFGFSEAIGASLEAKRLVQTGKPVDFRFRKYKLDLEEIRATDD